MKNSTRRWLAFVMAVVLVLTTAFFDGRKAQAEEAEAEIVTEAEAAEEELQTDVGTEDVQTETVTEDTTTEEITEVVTEEAPEVIPNEADEGLSEEAGEIEAVPEGDGTPFDALFSAFTEDEEILLAAPHDEIYTFNTSGGVMTVRGINDTDPIEAYVTDTSAIYKNAYLHCVTAEKASPFKWWANQVKDISWSVSSSSSDDSLGKYWDYYQGKNPNTHSQNSATLEPFSRAITAAHRANTGKRTYDGVKAPEAAKYYMCAGTTYTGTKVANGGTLTTTLDTATNTQKTGVYYLSTNDAKKYAKQKLLLPAGVTIHYSSDGGATYRTVTATANDTPVILNDSELVYFTAPSTTTGTVTVSSKACLSDGSNAYYLKAAVFFTPSTTLNGGNIQTLMLVTTETPSFSFNIELKEQTGYLELDKVSANVAATRNSDCYSLEGAIYGVYTSQANANTDTNRKYTLTTNASGVATLGDVPLGIYFIKEIKASKGFSLDTTVKRVEVKSENGATNPAKAVSDEQPLLDPMTIVVKKVSDTNTPVQGAVYEVCYYKTSQAYQTGANKDSDPALHGYTLDHNDNRSWRFKTDDKGEIFFSSNTTWFISGDGFYYGKNGSPSLPRGTVTIKEVIAPEGYEIDETVYVRTVANEDISVSAFNAPTSVDVQSRGDVEFRKVNEDGEPLANIKFKLTSDSTGESHIVWTDENGEFSTASSFAPHSRNTNGGEPGDGLWFGDITKLDDNRGALPSGSYTFTELRCEGNKDTYKNISPRTFSISTEDEVASLGDIKNEKFPTITTTARAKATESNVAAPGLGLELTDTVDLEKLEIGHTYTLSYKIWSKKDNDYLRDSEGNIYVETLSFIADKEKDSKDVAVTVDVSEAFMGSDIVFFEYLTDTAYPDELIASHADESFEEQTIHFPEIHTTAKDIVTYEHEGKAAEVSTIVDTVAYENLVPGKEYTLTATLMLKSTEKAVLDNDKPVVVEKTFVPEKADGTVDVEIVFNSEPVIGQTVVVFEDLSYNGFTVALHADINDEGQSVRYPDCGTTIKDKATDTREPFVDKELTLIDTVAYKELIPGKEHTVKGTLVFKDTGKVVVDADGKEVTGQTTFVPDKADGTVDVVFTFNASLLQGKTIVAFESIEYEGYEVAAHADLNDEWQTVHFPEVATMARDAVSLTHNGRRSHTSVIEDVVSYTNVTKGATYQVVGYLMDVDTGEVFKGEGGLPVSASCEPFVASDTEGSVILSFKVDSIPLLGKSLVVYEELYRIEPDGSKVLVGEHKVLTDEGQTVTYDNYVGWLVIWGDNFPGGGGYDISTPRTGDSACPYEVFALMCLAGMSLIVLRRKKEAKEHEEN